MDVRLAILAGTFLLLVAAVASFVVALIRLARTPKLPPVAVPEEWGGSLHDAPVDASLEGLTVEVSAGSPSAALLTPLRTGGWVPPAEPAPASELPQIALEERIASYPSMPAIPEPAFSVQPLEDWKVEAPTQPLPPVTAPAPLSMVAEPTAEIPVAPALLMSDAPIEMPTAPAPIEMPTAPAPIEMPTAPAPIEMPTAPAPLSAEQDMQTHVSWAASVPDVGIGAEAALAAEFAESEFDAEIAALLPSDENIADEPDAMTALLRSFEADSGTIAVPEADAMPVVDVVPPVAVRAESETQVVPEAEAAASLVPESLPPDQTVFAAESQPVPAAMDVSPIERREPEATLSALDAPVAAPVGQGDDAFWEAMFRQEQGLSSIAAAVEPAEPTRPAAIIHEPQGAPEHEAVPEALPPLPARPAVRVSGTVMTVDGRLEPGADDAAVERTGRDRAPEINMAAPVEMWFGEHRVGVKAGTNTYQKFRKYADVLLGDLSESRRSGR